ncbi:MAG: hypothetical protein GTO13_08605 [Proteobacteria bacterium]|nr:hypothetical protein [Pseudomonadota bacterium]
MERISRNYHARLQEMCDCYMETDYRKEIEKMASEDSFDVEEDALKYLALSILYATTEKAKKLSFKKKKGQRKVSVKAEERMELPTPPGEIADKIFEIMRSITHLEEKKGREPFSLGLRDGRMELGVRVKKGDDKESLKFSFPGL